MKTIKIFLASSEELENDRMAFGNLVRKLDKIYERRGIRVELFEWEDYDASYNNQRKQDEYNDHIKASDLFLALFHTKAGKFTIEEFDVATEEFRQKAAPKVYVYCKDLQPDETESPELTEFKKRLFDEMGHYWCRYGNRDTMQLHFVMQLQLVESNRMDALKVDDKGAVTLDGTPVAHMDQLPFAADNEAYQRMSAELAELPEKIEKARERVKKMPDDEDLRDDLQAKLDRYNQLKEDFAQLQQNLFSTAKTIANLQQQQVSSMLRRAIEAFEDGNLERANAILDEIAHEADQHMARLEQHKELLQKDREIIHQDIDAFHLQAQTIMADPYIPIEESIDRVIAIYAKADDWAQRSAYDKEKYISLLSVYGLFLHNYAHYEDAEKVILRQISMCKELYGVEHPYSALSYNALGSVYLNQGYYDKTLECYFKALDIIEKAQSVDYLDAKVSFYKDIGLTYKYIGDYPNAFEYFGKAVDIQEQSVIEKTELTGLLYSEIGEICRLLGDYENALDYCGKSIDILEEISKFANPNLARTYLNGGMTLYTIGDYDGAVELDNAAIEIDEMVLGPVHPETANAYSALGLVFNIKGDYDKALQYHHKALEIREKIFGTEHIGTAITYCFIGVGYKALGDYEKALEFHLKALEIREKVLGEEHIDTAESLMFTGEVFIKLGDYEKGLKYSRKALEILKHILGENHQYIAMSLLNTGTAYYEMRDFNKAMKYSKRALEMFEKVVGPEHLNVAGTREMIGGIYYQQGDYSKALKYYKKTLSIRESLLGPDNSQTALCYVNIGLIYSKNGDNDEAIKQYTKAQEIFDKTLPPEHPDIACNYNLLGGSYFEQGDFNRAMSFYEKALAINEKVLGKNHPETKNVKNNIELLKEAMKQGGQLKPSKGGFWSRMFGKKKWP